MNTPLQFEFTEDGTPCAEHMVLIHGIWYRVAYDIRKGDLVWDERREKVINVSTWPTIIITSLVHDDTNEPYNGNDLPSDWMEQIGTWLFAFADPDQEDPDYWDYVPVRNAMEYQEAMGMF